jgi:glycosyltransferase involved in cell wall biosynthesis
VFARERLRELGAPLDFERVHVLPPPVRVGDEGDGGRPAAPPREGAYGAASGAYALVVSRLSPEKGVDVAIDACRIAGVPLVVAGEGIERNALLARARGVGLAPRAHASPPKTQYPQVDPARSPHTDPSAGDVRFVGRIDDVELDRLREGAALAIVPSRSAETFGMAAAEAMAAGLPVAASRIGALPELVEEAGLVEPGDAASLAEAIGRLWGDVPAGARARARMHAMCSPQVVAEGLARVYRLGD